MKKIFILTSIFFISLTGVKSQQVILSNDTVACGTFNDTLYALSAELSGIAADDGHSGVVDLGFTFNFYGQSYNRGSLFRLLYIRKCSSPNVTCASGAYITEILLKNEKYS